MLLLGCSLYLGYRLARFAGSGRDSLSRRADVWAIVAAAKSASDAHRKCFDGLDPASRAAGYDGVAISRKEAVRLAEAYQAMETASLMKIEGADGWEARKAEVEALRKFVEGWPVTGKRLAKLATEFEGCGRRGPRELGFEDASATVGCSALSDHLRRGCRVRHRSQDLHRGARGLDRCKPW